MARDPRFDGRFFVGVVTTGIYCRPVCPARAPASDNVRFYPSAAAAEDAGFRPCRRCRPEAALGVPEWSLGSATVIRGLRLIEAGLLDVEDGAALAARLGVTPRHLNRLFRAELGATPKRLAMTRRRALAKRLLDETDLPISEVALQAGYRSVRRCNDDLRRCYGRSPRALRACRRGSAAGIALQLAVRPPYHPGWMFDFLARRALAGWETVTGWCYRRRVVGHRAGEAVWISVAWRDGALRLEVPPGCGMPLAEILLRVRRVFDLDADSAVVDAHLADDPLLAPVVAERGGLRVPGAWDGYETALRAVLGQQVSVARARVLAGRLLARFGDDALLVPRVLAAADPADLGVPARRGEAICGIAAAVAAGRLELHDGTDAGALQRALCAVPGIGRWTAGYVAMRVARDPDAFLGDDRVVRRVLAQLSARTMAASPDVAARAERWRPWRAYAVMYLWKAAYSTAAAAAGAAARAGEAG
jgi:AraC family transcriptional regulator of adaptative response / DNA-3-methyladenine glycosylase II